jgi:hypothetical protein
MSFPILLGLIIIGLDYYFHPKPDLIIDAIKDFGVVIIGVSLVEIVWSAMGGAPTEKDLKKLVEDVERTRNGIHDDVTSIRTEVARMGAITRRGDDAGIMDVAHSQGTLGSEPIFRQDIYMAKSGIDLCGSTLHYIYGSDSITHALVEAAKRKVPVRILLPSPSSNLLIAIFKDDYELNIKTTVESFTKKIKDQHSEINLRHLKVKALTTCILRVDDKMLAMPYLYAYQTQDSPRYLLRGNTRIFDKYQTEFDELFAIAEDV